MPRVVVTAIARADLAELIRTHSLPRDTEARFANAVQSLSRFPRELGGRFAGRRFILGPWRWMVIVYRWDPDRDLVALLAVVDARTAGSPTTER